jgi:DNA-binding NarL/FixJ family response regulator
MNIPPQISEAMDENPLRVLLADDSDSIRTNLIALLRKLPGVEVVGQSANGTETLELTESLKPELLILDIHMPGLSGMEVLRRLRAQGNELTSIIFTSYGEEGYRDAATKLGAKHFFTKLEFEQLLETVAAIARS